MYTVATPSHSLGVVYSLHVVATVPPRLDEIPIEAGLTVSVKPLCRRTAHVQHVNTFFRQQQNIFGKLTFCEDFLRIIYFLKNN